MIPVWDIIGRSVVIHEREDDGGKGVTSSSTVDGGSGDGVTMSVIFVSSFVFVFLCTRSILSGSG